MTYADNHFKNVLKDLVDFGVWDTDPRPAYKDGTPAHSKFITDVYVKYPEGITPIISLRHTAWKTGIREILAIYQKQTSNLDELVALGVNWWSDWQIPFDNKKVVEKVKVVTVPDAACDMVEIPLQNEIRTSVDGKIYHSNYREYGDYILVDRFTKNGYSYYTYQFINTGYIGEVRKDSIDRGQHPKDNFVRTLLGVGYLGNFAQVGGFTDTQLKNLKHKWHSMMHRAYDGTRKWYDGIMVDAEWHSFENFLKTIKSIPQFEFAKVDDFNSKWELDKDYYGKNHYSPLTTVFSLKEDNIDYRYVSTPIEVTSIIDGSVNTYLTASALAKKLGIRRGRAINWANTGGSPDKTLKIEKLEEAGYVYRYKLQRPNIGIRYGATVAKWNLMNKLLDGLVDNPFGRRHILNLYQESDLVETAGLHPCAFLTMFSCRQVKEEMYLDCALVQRSSDYLTAASINSVQYKALQMMIATHCGYKVGTFSHYIMNLHVYDRHAEQAAILATTKGQETEPHLVLNAPSGTNFYDIKLEDFEMKNYHPFKHEPKLVFELAI